MYDFKFGRLENLEHEIARVRDISVRYQHTYILGTTGTGKTSLMLRMALYDINYGCACIFIDPKGDHARALYNLIPDKDRVVYFSYNHPSLTINPLRKSGYHPLDISDEFTEVLDIVIKQASATNPPASENMKEIITQTILALAEEDRNIDFLYDFLTYKNVRNNYFQKSRPDYWRHFDQVRKGRVADEVLTARRIAVRLSKFIMDERFKKIISGKNELDIADIARNKKVIIVDTSGMSLDKRIYITALFSFAVKSYCEFQKQEKYYPLMFYLDECWMGVNDSFEYLLSFARSFKVGLTLAHQNLHQFSDYKTVKRIISICNTKVAYFPAGNEEARLLAEIFGLTLDDFRKLGTFQAWVRIGNKNTLVKTYPPPEPETLDVPELEPEKQAISDRTKLPEETKNVNFLRDCWFPC